MESIALEQAKSKVMETCYQEGLKTGVITVCKKKDCTVDCTADAQWQGKPTIKHRRKDIKKYNVGSSTEAWVFTFELWPQVGINLKVVCVCPDTGGGGSDG